nr:hypothetical protein [Lachnospiraceae bacterium]
CFCYSYRMLEELENIGIDASVSGKERISVTQQWIKWAKEKADWYDPTIAREDEYLGKRDHGKNRDEKDLDKKQVNRSWYR